MIDIQALADEKGIARTYLDATNKLVTISEQSIPYQCSAIIRKINNKKRKKPLH